MATSGLQLVSSTSKRKTNNFVGKRKNGSFYKKARNDHNDYLKKLKFGVLF